MSHSGLVLHVKSEKHQIRGVMHLFAIFKNIVTFLMGILETGGAALDTALMISPHLEETTILRLSNTLP